MRQRILVSIRDVKVGEHTLLMVFHTPEEAKRLFLSAVDDPKGHIGRFPTDYTVNEIGLFNPETGKITPHEIPVDLTPYSERDAIVAARKLANLTPKEV